MKSNRTRKLWTDKEIKFLRACFATNSSKSIAEMMDRTVTSINGMATKLNLRKDPAYLEHLNKDLGSKLAVNPSAVANRFYKGQTSYNAGKKGLRIPGSEKGWFKKSHLPHNTLTDGVIVVRRRYNRSCPPYKWIRIARGKWEMLHVYNWKKANGPIPEGHIIVFKNGDQMDCNIENLQCIDRKQHAANTRNRDEYIAARMALTPGCKGVIDREKYRQLLKHPELIDAKRKQMELARRLRDEK